MAQSSPDFLQSGPKESFQETLVQLNSILGIDSVLDLIPFDGNESAQDGSGHSPQGPVDVDAFQANVATFEMLHDQITLSTKMLDVLDSSLVKFQSDLDKLSQDMEQLQQRSLTHQKRLEIRKAVEDQLAPLIEALIIPPSIVHQIAEKEVSPQWRAALKYMLRRKKEIETLGGKLEATEGSLLAVTSPTDDTSSNGNKEHSEGAGVGEPLSASSQVPFALHYKAMQAARSQIDKVLIKAVERCREYFISRIKMLRTPGINAQAVQVELLANQPLYAFLFTQHKQLALELRQAYLFTMRWYYHTYFSRYIKSLEKYNIHRVSDGRSILVGSSENDAARRLAASKKSNSMAMDFLNIGNRAQIVASDDPTILVSHMAENSTRTSWAEIGYRSLCIALIDNATAEYSFIADFFVLEPREQPQGLFGMVFEPTYADCHAYSKFLVDASPYDAYAILIFIRLCAKFELELQHRKIPVAQDYFNLELLNLWPKFQHIIDMQCDSLRKATARFSSYSIPGLSAGQQNTANAKGDKSTASASASAIVPHYTTQQFATLVYGILSLCDQDGSESQPVATSLRRLRSDFESFLTKLSATLHKSSESREKFLYNNYFLIATIISTLEGTLVKEEQDHFDKLVKAYSESS